jgi:biopolymer transport protein ExbD
MRFYSKKRRQAPAIIIVALIDILIVLLIFLMVTTTFKQQPALKLALPESSQAQKAGANEKVPLVVSIETNGAMRFGPEGKPVTFERLRDELVSSSVTNKELSIAIRADQGAPFGQVIKVMDAAKEAHIKTVNAFAKEPGKS